jgi:hypothetical protein
MPADVTGATLLALGNGAPDLFTNIGSLGNAVSLHMTVVFVLGSANFIILVQTQANPNPSWYSRAPSRSAPRTRGVDASPSGVVRSIGERAISRDFRLQLRKLSL